MADVEDVFKALGDPTRIRILRMLAQNGEMCVCKIMEELSMTQPAVSHHLATLKYARLVDFRRDGQWIHYSLNQATLGAAKEFLENVLEKMESAPTGNQVCQPEGRVRYRSPEIDTVDVVSHRT